MLPSLASAKCFKAKGNSKLSQMPLKLKPGKRKIRNTWNAYMYTYTLGDILKKGFKTFFMSQFTACAPTGKENKEVKDTSKLLIRVLAYAQVFQEIRLVKWVSPSTKAIINSSENSFTWPSVCALTPLRCGWASSAPTGCALLMLPAGWATSPSCRSRFWVRAFVR